MTKLEVINGALSRLGAEPISSELLDVAEREFGEGQPETPGGEGGIQDGLSSDFDEVAAAAVSVYPQARTHILVAHPWSFLAHREQLQQPDPPERQPWWPYTYRYTPPRNLLDNIRAVYRDVGGSGREHPMGEGWTVLSGFIFADWEPAWADYQRDEFGGRGDAAAGDAGDPGGLHGSDGGSGRE